MCMKGKNVNTAKCHNILQSEREREVREREFISSPVASAAASVTEKLYMCAKLAEHNKNQRCSPKIIIIIIPDFISL